MTDRPSNEEILASLDAKSSTGVELNDAEYLALSMHRTNRALKSALDKKDVPVLTDLVEVGDPWKHRTAGMKCQSCMWFVVKQDPEAAVDAKVKGRCRRHAPTMNGYPVVFVDDWCGDHKLA